MADHRKPESGHDSGWYELSHLERPNPPEQQTSPTPTTSRDQPSWFRRILQAVGMGGRMVTPAEGRRIPLHVQLRGSEPLLVDNRTGQPYLSNRIRTSRYTVWNFLPRQLLYQFSRLANAYFLIIAILQMIPGFSTTGRFTTIIPLLVFVFLTMAKEGYDDFKRYRLDKAENNSRARILQPGVGSGHESPPRNEKRSSHGSGLDSLLPPPRVEPTPVDAHWVTTRWGDLQVGDIVKLRDGDQVPADLVLLHAENTIAYVDTRALDGETTLKSKFVSTAFQALRLDSTQDIHDAHILLEVEQPNQDLYSFDGTVTTGGTASLPLTLDNILYRGCEVRNSRSLVGVVINTGEDTKIRMNANKDPPEKRPALEKFVNMIVVFLALYMLVTSLLLYMGFKLYWRGARSDWYLMNEEVPDEDVLVGFIIQFSNVVPMSLIMAIEAVKLNLAYLVNSDLELYHEESDTPANCNTNVILDDLGQIDYVFSDKTGTLTDNIMKLRRLSVAGASWFHRDRARGTEPAEEEEEEEDDNKAALSAADADADPPNEMTTEDLVDFVRGNPALASAQASFEYILGMAICHTCIPDVDPQDGSIVDFQASSPDELALVRGARELGILVTERSTHAITVEFPDGYHVVGGGDRRRQTFEILDVIEFSSKRKRMSIIVRRPDGRIWLICKGADTLVLPRLGISAASASSQQQRQQQEEEPSLQALDRTHRSPTSLSYGRRSREFLPNVVPHSPLSPILDAVDAFELGSQTPLSSTSPYHHHHLDHHHMAGPSQPTSPLPWPSDAEEAQYLKSCLDHIDSYAREGLRTLVFAHRTVPEDEYAAWKREYREAQLSLDRRQDKVERVGGQMEAGLRLLGATGVEDKLQKGVPETITRLRRAGIKIWMLTGDKRETAINIAHSSQICTAETALFQLDVEQGDLAWQLTDILDALARQPLAHTALVIDGQTLTAFDHPSVAPLRDTLFRELIPQLHSVLCCRASPSQKALLVSAVRDEVPPPPPHLSSRWMGGRWLGWLGWWVRTSARSHLRPRTLAIGDGANDLAMLTAANVGVGLSGGREGQQAARVADVSVAQFRHLARLLLVHGRWNYHRITRFVLGSFWKETLFWFPAALYQGAAGFTGTSVYEATALTLYGVAFTTLCTMTIGAFEQDLAAPTLLAVPELYAYGRRARGLNWGVFASWVANAVLAGTTISLVVWAAYGGWFLTTPDDNGLYAMGTLVFISCMIWTNIKVLLLEMRYKTVLVLLIFAFSFTLIWLFHLLVGYIFNGLVISPYAVVDGLTRTFGRDLAWWATLGLVLGCLGVVEVTVATVRQRMSGMALLGGKRNQGEGEGEGERLAGMSTRVWKELERDPQVQRRLRELYEDEG